MTQKAASFDEPKTEVSAKDPAAAQAALILGPYDPANPVMLEMSVADRDAVWSLWQTLISESQCRTLGFLSQALSSSEDNFSF